MDAIATANRGWVAVCTVHREQNLSPSCKRVNLASSVRRTFSSGTALRSSPLSTNFEDQSHVQFYLNVRCSRKEKMSKRSPRALRKEMGGFEDCVRGMDEQKEKKKMEKMRGGKRMSTSSSSSSSSESDDSDCEMRGTMTREPEDMRTERKFAFELKTEMEEPRGIRRGRKFDMELFKKEWEELSRSELMNSIPRFTSDFKIEPPLAVTIEHLQKSFSLPTTRPPPPMVEDSVAVEQPSCTAASPSSSIISHSLKTVVGLAVVEDTSDASGVTEIKPASAHVEVCMGGKCKKGGGGEVLNAFQVAGRPGVTASPCKCMKNCKSAVNVRIQEQDGNSQVYTGVSLEDVDVLLQKHYSTGTSVAGLSSFNSQQFDRDSEIHD